MGHKVLFFGVCAICATLIWRAWMLGSSLPEPVGAADDVADDLGLRGSTIRIDAEEAADAADEAGEIIGEAPDASLPAQQKLSVLVTKESISRLDEREAVAQQRMQDHNEFVSMWAKGKAVPPKPVKDLARERHFTHTSWFEPEKKYFVYQPSGGMSNQRIILEQAVLVAKALGRTLVVPPVCPHTSMFWNYNKVNWDRTVDGFRVFEESRMNNAVSTMGLSNIILRRFVEFNEPRAFPKWHRVELPYKMADRDPPYTTQDLQRIYGDDPAEVLFFAKYSMWKRFDFTEDELEYARQHVQLTAEFRRVARLAVEGLFGQAPFVAVHVRFQDRDTALLTDKLSPAPSFVRRLAKHNATDISSQLYVATQPSRATSTYFDTFRKAGFELTFSSALAKVPEVGRFLSQFPPNDIQMSLLGIIEQLICTRASLFLGTGFSTFSRYIRVKRQSPVLFFDLSLLPMRFQEDSEFIQGATSEEVVEAFRDAKGTSAEHELQLVSRETQCSSEVVSLVAC